MADDDEQVALFGVPDFETDASMAEFVWEICCISMYRVSHCICRLSIQQHQHALLLEQKDAEIAHMKARICLDAVTSRGKGAYDLCVLAVQHVSI